MVGTRRVHSTHVVMDDFPHSVVRVVGRGLLLWRYSHRFGLIRIPPRVLRVGQSAYHQWYQCGDWSTEMSYLRQVTEVIARSGAGKARDPVMEGSMPAIHEFLTSLVDADGAPRVTATLGISTDGDRWILRMADRHTGTVCFHAGESLQEALGGLEERLVAGTCDWRVDAYAKPKRKKG